LLVATATTLTFSRRRKKARELNKMMVTDVSNWVRGTEHHNEQGMVVGAVSGGGKVWEGKQEMDGHGIVKVERGLRDESGRMIAEMG
jgi:hypothetical protein